MLNLLNAVDNQGGYLGGGDWSKVSKSGLSAKICQINGGQDSGLKASLAAEGGEGLAVEEVPRRSWRGC